MNEKFSIFGLSEGTSRVVTSIMDFFFLLGLLVLLAAIVFMSFKLGYEVRDQELRNNLALLQPMASTMMDSYCNAIKDKLCLKPETNLIIQFNSTPWQTSQGNQDSGWAPCPANTTYRARPDLSLHCDNSTPKNYPQRCYDDLVEHWECLNESR